MNHQTKKKIRRQARGKLYKLLKDQKGKCAYCSRVIVRLASVPPTRRIKVTQCKVTYINKKGKKHTSHIATVDHKKRIVDGGDNSDDNIVACCAHCNFEKDKKNFKSTKSWICACGEQKENKKANYCKKCWFFKHWIRKCKNDYY